MKKRLFICVASWFAAPGQVQIRTLYGTALSPDEARGMALRELDEIAPEYKSGSKFNLLLKEIPEETIRECL